MKKKDLAFYAVVWAFVVGWMYLSSLLVYDYVSRSEMTINLDFYSGANSLINAFVVVAAVGVCLNHYYRGKLEDHSDSGGGKSE